MTYFYFNNILTITIIEFKSYFNNEEFKFEITKIIIDALNIKNMNINFSEKNYFSDRENKIIGE